MSQIVAACHEKDVTCKVIFENCYLNDEEKIKLCEIAKEVKPDFIKTSTGFGDRVRCPTYRNKCWYLDHQGIRSYDERTRRFHT